MAARRRRFGRVRKLPSGKYQASFVGPNGRRQNAPDTFLTKTDASTAAAIGYLTRRICSSRASRVRW